MQCRANKYILLFHYFSQLNDYVYLGLLNTALQTVNAQHIYYIPETL